MGTIGIWLIVVILLVDLYLKYYHKRITKPANTASKILNKVIDTFHNLDSATISPSFQNSTTSVNGVTYTRFDSKPRMLKVFTEDGLYLFDRPENSADIHELMGTKYKLVYRDTGENYESTESS